MPTLYVSDLDGTLLRSDQRTSEYTNRVINALVGKGMRFSYATARSANTARKVTAGMTAAFPVIVYNGAFIRDNQSGEILLQNFFTAAEALPLAQKLLRAGVRPVVYGFVDGEEKFSYLADEINPGTREFVESRRGDPRDRPVKTVDELLRGELFYFACIDAPEILEPFYEKYRVAFHCVYQKDIYSGEQWLELMPRAASKANAIRQLAARLGCERIVAFGDGVNDLDMFAIADEAYAVANAVPELQKAATAVIGGNDGDGVAKWLEKNAKLGE